MFANRRDPVGVKNSAFEEIQAAKELDAMQGEKALGQIG